VSDKFPYFEHLHTFESSIASFYHSLLIHVFEEGMRVFQGIIGIIGNIWYAIFSYLGLIFPFVGSILVYGRKQLLF
jgi:hypothetical protein